MIKLSTEISKIPAANFSKLLRKVDFYQKKFSCKTAELFILALINGIFLQEFLTSKQCVG